MRGITSIFDNKLHVFGGHIRSGCFPNISKWSLDTEERCLFLFTFTVKNFLKRNIIYKSRHGLHSEPQRAAYGPPAVCPVGRLWRT